MCWPHVWEEWQDMGSVRWQSRRCQLCNRLKLRKTWKGRDY